MFVVSQDLQVFLHNHPTLGPMENFTDYAFRSPACIACLETSILTGRRRS
jgi:hypothetical protein